MGIPPQARRRISIPPPVEEFQAPGGNGLALQSQNTCANCRWATPNARPNSFKCRRWPPVVNQSRPGEAIFPICEADDWCGEFSQ